VSLRSFGSHRRLHGAANRCQALARAERRLRCLARSLQWPCHLGGDRQRHDEGAL